MHTISYDQPAGAEQDRVGEGGAKLMLSGTNSDCKEIWNCNNVALFVLTSLQFGIVEQFSSVIFILHPQFYRQQCKQTEVLRKVCKLALLHRDVEILIDSAGQMQVT